MSDPLTATSFLAPLVKLSITHKFLNIKFDKSQELCILYSHTESQTFRQEMEEWITQELERTELGDKRRTKRLIKIVSNLSAQPEASVPQANGTWSALL